MIRSPKKKFLSDKEEEELAFETYWAALIKQNREFANELIKAKEIAIERGWIMSGNIMMDENGWYKLAEHQPVKEGIYLIYDQILEQIYSAKWEPYDEWELERYRETGLTGYFQDDEGLKQDTFYWRDLPKGPVGEIT